ncbi:hypothetical protein [Streptomyces sp. NPDC002825]|uniref:hypothetical protein n=1 Tax=Streptomyces sp. NPDC002825 TaxID=3154666 RepID=UPI003320F821
MSEQLVQRWRRAWRERGQVAVLSHGSPGLPVVARRDADRRTGAGVGAWPAGPGLGGAAMDVGAGQDVDRPAVPRLLHRRGHVAIVEAGTAGVGSCRPDVPASGTTTRLRWGRRKPGRG